MAMDHFDLDVSVSGIDNAINGGALSTDTFDADLAAAITSARMHANPAVPSSVTCVTMISKTMWRSLGLSFAAHINKVRHFG